MKRCLACVLTAERVRFDPECHLGFKTLPLIRERSKPQSGDKSTFLGVPRRLLGL